MQLLSILASISPIITSWPMWIHHFLADADFDALFEGTIGGFQMGLQE
jgi:hypothetical protein